MRSVKVFVSPLCWWAGPTPDVWQARPARHCLWWALQEQHPSRHLGRCFVKSSPLFAGRRRVYFYWRSSHKFGVWVSCRSDSSTFQWRYSWQTSLHSRDSDTWRNNEITQRRYFPLIYDLSWDSQKINKTSSLENLIYIDSKSPVTLAIKEGRKTANITFEKKIIKWSVSRWGECGKSWEIMKKESHLTGKMGTLT